MGLEKGGVGRKEQKKGRPRETMPACCRHARTNPLSRQFTGPCRGMSPNPSETERGGQREREWEKERGTDSRGEKQRECV